jgi:hypothetical protein
MAPPSKLAIATGSLKRLIKEEASYHKELSQQEARIKKLEAGSEDENAEYQLKQEVCPLLASVHAAALVMSLFRGFAFSYHATRHMIKNITEHTNLHII